METRLAQQLKRPEALGYAEKAYRLSPNQPAIMDTLAVILTGMGQDGLRGVEQLRALGGYVIAQDEASSVVWGMPGFVARAGLADTVCDLKAVAPEIVRHL